MPPISFKRTHTPASTQPALAPYFRHPARLAVHALVAGALLWSSLAAAQTCPTNFSACDNTGCCLTSEQCCPTLAEGCCSSATPFCCGDGTCAVTPSECGFGTRADCDGYDVPCGDGCAPAGSDCCDLAGHYCPPESRCTSDTTCVRGVMPTMALEVDVVNAEAVGSVPLAPPYADPATATERSCSLHPPAPGATFARAGWLGLAAGLVALRWRRGRRAA
jgi:hypothetical protein